MTWVTATLRLPNDDVDLSFPYNCMNMLPLMLQAPSDSHPSTALMVEEDLSSAYSSLHQTPSTVPTDDPY